MGEQRTKYPVLSTMAKWRHCQTPAVITVKVTFANILLRPCNNPLSILQRPAEFSDRVPDGHARMQWHLYDLLPA